MLLYLANFYGSESVSPVLKGAVDHKVIMEVAFTVCKISLETWDGICEDVIKFTDITTII